MRTYVFSWVLVLSLIASVGFGCAARKLVAMGPGHDADWPIEAPDADAYRAYLHAKRYSQQGRVDEAIEAFEEALRHDPKSPLILVQLAHEFARKGDLEGAERTANLALGIDGKFKEAYFLLGKIHAARGEWEKSEEVLLSLIKLDDSEEQEGVIALATVYVQSRNLEKASGLLGELVEQKPDHILAHYYLGRVFSEMNRLDDALVSYERAARINPDFTSALKAIAFIYDYKGERDKAVESFRQVLSVERDNVNIRKYIAQLLLDEGKYDEALAEFQAVARENPQDVGVRLRIGLIHLRGEDLPAARATFEELLRVHPQLDRVRYYLGVVLERLHETDAALSHFSGIPSTSEVYDDAVLSSAFLYETKAELGKAEKLVRAALEKKPKSPELVSGLASILVKMKREGEAVALLQNALTKSPKSEMLWFSLGEVYDKIGNLAKLDECMRAVLEVNPDNADALNYLGYTYADKGIRLADAEQLIIRALKIRPKDGYITDSLGWVYFRKGQFEAAVKKLEEAVELVPNDATIMEHLADALMKTGKTKRAKDIYEQAIELAKEHPAKSRLREKIDGFPK